MSLARELKSQSPKCTIIYIGLKGETLDRLRDEYAVFDEVYYVPAGKFRRYHGESFWSQLTDIKTLALNVRDFFRVIAGIVSSWRVLRHCSPDVLFSKGGFVAVPVGIAAKTFSIPIITHDSDSVPGLANRLIGRWAAVHATGMPPSYYKYRRQTVRYVGIPTDSRIVPVNQALQSEYKQQLGLDPQRKVLVVSGGGHGAQTLNEMVTEAAAELFKHRPDLAIFHFAGTKHQARVQKSYAEKLDPENLGKVQVIDFRPDFYIYCGAADLVVTRAGATTLAELAIQGKACLVIPSPFLTGGHQVKNAHQLKDAGAVESLPNNATPHELFQAVIELLDDEARRGKLSATFASLSKPNASAELAEIILQQAVAKDHA